MTKTENRHEIKTVRRTTDIKIGVKENKSVGQAYLVTRNVREHTEYKDKPRKVKNMLKKSKE